MKISAFLNSKFTKIVSGIVILTYSTLVLNVAYANSVLLPANQQQRANTAKIEGNAKGVEYLRNLQTNTDTTNIGANGDINFNSVKIDDTSTVQAWQINNVTIKDAQGNDQKLSMNSLSPDSNLCSNPEQCKKYYLNGKAPDTKDMQGIANQKEDVLISAAQSTHNSLAADVKNDRPEMSVQSHVYATLNDTANLQKPDLSDDPMLENSNSVLSNSVSNPFTDCAQTNSLVSKLKTTKHTPIYKVCVENKSDTCTIVKQPSFSVLVYLSGNGGKYEYNTCGENCTTYYIGDTGNGKKSDYISSMKSGECIQASTTFSVHIANQDAIKKVTLKTVSYAGAIKVLVDSTQGKIEKIPLLNLNSYGNSVNTSGSTVCTKNMNYVRKTVNVDLTEYFSKRKATDMVNFQIEYNGPKPILDLDVEFDPKLVARDDVWYGDQDCLNKAESVNNGSLNGHVKCTSAMEVEPNGKVRQNGIELNPQYLTAEFGLPGQCIGANIEIIDDNLPTEEILCSTLRDQGCSFTGASCLRTEDSDNVKNKCVLYQYTYDCGYDNDVTAAHGQQGVECPGNIACMGVDCLNLIVDDGTENAKDFNKALALLNESQQAATDATCTRNADGTLNCVFFAGEYKWCSKRKMLGASNDCCDSPQQINVRQQIEAAIYAQKVYLIKDMALTHDIFEGTLGMGQDYRGPLLNGDWSSGDISGGYSFIGGTVWNVLKNYTGVGQKFQKVVDNISKPMVSVLNNIIPYAGEVFAAGINAGIDIAAGDILAYGIEKIVGNVVENWAKQAISWVMEKIATACAQMFGESAFSAGMATAANNMLGSGVGSSMAGTWPSELAGTSLGSVIESQGGTIASGTASALGTCICVIGWIYAIYTIGKMIANIMIQCKEEEYEVASLKEQKLCDEVGTYCASKFLGSCKEYRHVHCCFTSQLSRILNKQIRYSLKGYHMIYPIDAPEIAYGEAKNADCSGLNQTQIALADWTKVDLTEWLTLLKDSGQLSSDRIDVDSIRTNYLPAGMYDSNGNKNNSQVTPKQ